MQKSEMDSDKIQVYNNLYILYCKLRHPTISVNKTSEDAYQEISNLAYKGNTVCILFKYCWHIVCNKEVPNLSKFDKKKLALLLKDVLFLKNIFYFFHFKSDLRQIDYKHPKFQQFFSLLAIIFFLQTLLMLDITAIELCIKKLETDYNTQFFADQRTVIRMIMTFLEI